MGKCSSVLSCDNWASTWCRVVTDDLASGAAVVDRLWSSITFQSPGFPSPATVLRKPGGAWLSFAPLKSKYRSAPRSGHTAKRTARQRIEWNIGWQSSKPSPDDKCLGWGVRSLSGWPDPEAETFQRLVKNSTASFSRLTGR